jgi:hypothetical protein
VAPLGSMRGRLLAPLLLIVLPGVHGIAMPGVGFFARARTSALAPNKVPRPSSDAGYLDAQQAPGRPTFWLEDLHEGVRQMWRKVLITCSLSDAIFDARPAPHGALGAALPRTIPTAVGLRSKGVRVVPIKWLKPHEQVIPKNLEAVQSSVVDAGAYTKPILVDRATGTILDGHHRHEVGRRLGLTRLPALLIDYQSDPMIRLDVWPTCGRTALTKQEVIDMALSPSVFPPKTSRHHYDGFDMNSDLPEIDVPLHALSGGTGYVRAEFQA